MRTLPKLRWLVVAAVALAGIFFCAPRSSASEELEAILREVQGHLENGNLTAARAQLEEAARRFPDDPTVQNFTGVAAVQEGRPAAAEAHFRKALELSPRYEGAYLNLGRLLLETAGGDEGKLEQAQEVYRTLLRVNPGSLEAKYQLAFISARRRDFAASQRFLDLIPSSHRDRAQVLALACLNQTALGYEAEAREAALALGLSADLNEVDVLWLVPLLVEQKAEDRAIELLEALDRRRLAGFDTLFELGRLYHGRQLLPQARAVLLKAAEARPNDVTVLAELARVAEAQKDYPSALSFLAHARDLEPKNAALHFSFGLVSLHMNLVIEASQSLDRAVALDPENPQYNFLRGVVAVQRTQYRDAVRFFEKYGRLRPDDLGARLALGAAYFYSHEREAALRELNECAKVPQTAAGAHYFLARLANQMGELAKAEEHLQEALRQAPNFSDAYAELGLLHLKQRNFEQAEEALMKALDLDPESYQAHLYLTQLFSRTRDPRAGAQSKAFDDLKKRRAEKVKEFYRMVEVRPQGF
jgi:tetratricopeptide (TPR) repeat protein